MGILSRVWVAMRTQNIEDAGTEDSLVLIINDDGLDKLHHILRITPKRTGRTCTGSTWKAWTSAPSA